MAEWSWIPDADGTPDNPVKKPETPKAVRASDVAAAPSVDTDIRGSTTGGGGSGGDGSNDGSGVYSIAELLQWKPALLKELLSDLSLDSSGCAEKRDIVQKIATHPGGLAAAAAAAVARGDVVRRRSEQAGGDETHGSSDGDKSLEPAGSTPPQKEQENDPMGMTLADYMSQSVLEDNVETGRGRGRPRPSTSAPRLSLSVGSGNSIRPGTASSANLRTVRLAPAHIAPPSRPAPEWVLEMQVSGSPTRQVQPVTGAEVHAVWPPLVCVYT